MARNIAEQLELALKLLPLLQSGLAELTLLLTEIRRPDPIELTQTGDRLRQAIAEAQAARVPTDTEGPSA